MEEDFNSKIEEINKKHELEKKENEEKKRQLEEEIKRKEEEEKRKIEEHNRNVSYANDAINNIESNILNNLRIEVRQKEISELYEQTKILANNMIPKNSLIQYIDERLTNLSEKMVKNMIVDSKHFNIILLGKTGIGKSTLINGILKLDKLNYAKEGFGKSTTKGFKEYTSSRRPGLRLIDSRGIEIGKHNIIEVINSVTDYIEKIAQEGDPDKFIHCIWYCIESNSARVEEEEEDAIKEFKDIYEEKKLPVIFVLTKSYNKIEYSKMIKYLNDLGINDIVPVLAKAYPIELDRGEIRNIKPRKLKELIKLSFDKCKDSGFHSFKKSLKEKIFYQLLEYFQELYTNINNSVPNFSSNNNRNQYYNEGKLINNITNYSCQIITQYIESNNSNEIFNFIEQNIDNFLQVLYNSNEVVKIIGEFMKEFNIQYNKNKNSIIAKYQVFMNEVNPSYNNKAENVIKNNVITKVLGILSSKILKEFNNLIMDFIFNEIKKRKKNRISINIPEHLKKEIQRISDNIYKNLGNISDDENESESEEEKMSIKNKKNKVMKNKIAIRRFSKDDSEDEEEEVEEKKSTKTKNNKKNKIGKNEIKIKSFHKDNSEEEEEEKEIINIKNNKYDKYKGKKINNFNSYSIRFNNEEEDENEEEKKSNYNININNKRIQKFQRKNKYNFDDN